MVQTVSTVPPDTEILLCILTLHFLKEECIANLASGDAVLKLVIDDTEI